MLVGLIDGDGYISINKSDSRGYLAILLVIAVEGADIQMLYYIKSVLGFGRINYYPATNTAKYIINKTDLQELLFPLLKHHKLYFLTLTRQLQYNKAIYLMSNNISMMSLIPQVIAGVPSTMLAQSYLALPFFNN